MNDVAKTLIQTLNARCLCEYEFAAFLAVCRALRAGDKVNETAIECLLIAAQSRGLDIKLTH